MHQNAEIDQDVRFAPAQSKDALLQYGSKRRTWGEKMTNPHKFPRKEAFRTRNAMVIRMKESTELKISRALFRLGVSIRRRGWDYLHEAVLLAMRESALSERGIFERVASAHGVGVSTVRRVCRKEVYNAYASGFPAYIDGYLPSGQKLSAGQFILLTAKKLSDGEL